MEDKMAAGAFERPGNYGWDSPFNVVDVFVLFSMPYAQVHYPFERKEEFDSGFPADFIAEGIDQTRGW